MNESLALASHISGTKYEDLPGNVTEATKKSFLDAIGVMLAAGTLGEKCRQFVELARAEKCKEESSILGFSTKTSPAWAAFANGSMAHALDFEDTHDIARVHPNAAAIPAALAIAESMGNVTGKQLITSLALGSDIVCRLGLSFTEDPIKNGWYMPPILGAFGATTAVGKLLNLSPEQIVNAFSLTLCQATCSAELTFSPDSVIRGIRDAFSAKAGVLSAQLAAKNVNGFEHPLEGRAGLFRLYGRENIDLQHLTDKLGEVFEGGNVSFKPWPSCRGTHSFIETTLKCIKEKDFRPGDIEEIIVGVDSSPVNLALLEPSETKRRPRKAIDAKFSIPYTIALVINKLNVTLEDFLPESLENPEILSVTPNIHYQVMQDYRIGEGKIDFKTKKGGYSYSTPEFVLGHPENPMPMENLINKFKDCARYAPNQISQGNLDEFIKQVLHLENVPDVGVLISRLS